MDAPPQESSDIIELDIFWQPQYSSKRLLSHVYLWSFWLGKVWYVRKIEYPSKWTTDAVVAFEKVLAESLEFKKKNYMRVAAGGCEMDHEEAEVAQGVFDGADEMDAEDRTCLRRN
jgi:hypothetical protein